MRTSRKQIFARPGVVYQAGVPPGRIDILTELTGRTFDEAWADRLRRPFGDVDVDFIGRAVFIRNKRATGRTRDLGGHRRAGVARPSHRLGVSATRQPLVSTEAHRGIASCQVSARTMPSAGVAKLADARDLKSREGQPSCGFDSRPRHLESATYRKPPTARRPRLSPNSHYPASAIRAGRLETGIRASSRL